MGKGNFTGCGFPESGSGGVKAGSWAQAIRRVSGGTIIKNLIIVQLIDKRWDAKSEKWLNSAIFFIGTEFALLNVIV
ncbi:hypothetical protein [Bacilliculturomica massiliensis]|uniref:hypothetical protein n=1 Tax=Bacilliculturomica massiliensis TaxID=1917867 RepID=UPI0010301DD5|nr:hypothetical protein [Bacilliculturomica massiliensis]